MQHQERKMKINNAEREKPEARMSSLWATAQFHRRFLLRAPCSVSIFHLHPAKLSGIATRRFVRLPRRLLALVATEAAVVAKVLGLRLRLPLLLLPLLLVRSLLATTVTSCALWRAPVSHW